MSSEAPAADAAASSASTGRSPFLSIAEQKEKALQKQKAMRAKKKQKALQAAQQKKQDAVRHHETAWLQDS